MIGNGDKHFAAMGVSRKAAGVATGMDNQNAEFAQNRFGFFEALYTLVRRLTLENLLQAMKSTAAAADAAALDIGNDKTVTDPLEFSGIFALPQLKFIRPRLLLVRGRDDQIIP